MHFLINKNTLINHLNLVSRAISNFSPLPAYSGIKFETKDNRLYLTGSDSDISIETYINCDTDEKNYLEIKKDGAIVIDARNILDIIRKIDSSVVELEILDGCTIAITGGSSKIQLIGMYANEYPVLDFKVLENNFDIKSDLLKLIINQTLFATSDKETRPVFTGLNFEYNNNNLYVTGTDGYRLAKKVISIDGLFDFNITIPRRSLNEVIKSLESHEMVKIALSESKIQFIFDNTIIQTRLIDAKFPETNKLIPTQFSTEVIFNLTDIMKSIDRASFIKNDDISLIKLEVNEEKCILSSKSQEVGSIVETIDTFDFKGEPLTISFNGRYVLEALKTIKNEKVIFKFAGDMDRFIIQEYDNADLTQLILPVKTY